MQGIIDFHAHAFPDQVAASAIPYLEEEGTIFIISVFNEEIYRFQVTAP